MTSRGLQQQNMCLVKTKANVMKWLSTSKKMAGIDINSSPSEHSKDQRLSEIKDENDVLWVNSMNVPYQNEPLALGPQSEEDFVGEEADEDGLSFATIKARYDRVEPVAQWFVLYFYYWFLLDNLRSHRKRLREE